MPAAAASVADAGADAALAATLEGGVSGGIGQLATAVAATSLTPIPQGGVSLFHVGIGPFIAASIAMSVLTATIPSLKELTKDPVGQHTVKQYTRYITLAVAFVQSWITAQNLRPYCALGFEAKSYAVVATCLFTCGALAAGVAGGRDDRPGFGAGHVRDDHRLRVQCVRLRAETLRLEPTSGLLRCRFCRSSPPWRR